MTWVTEHFRKLFNIIWIAITNYQTNESAKLWKYLVDLSLRPAQNKHMSQLYCPKVMQYYNAGLINNHKYIGIFISSHFKTQLMEPDEKILEENKGNSIAHYLLFFPTVHRCIV